MTVFSPTAAAFEGFRVMRREPRAVLVWMVLWLAWLSIGAGIVASGKTVVVSNHGAYRSFWEITRHFGSFAVVLVALFLLVWATTTVAAFRAVLEPTDRRFLYLRL